MRNRISFAVFLLLAHLSSWAQIGGDYNPNNPSDPGNPTQEYTLTLKASPSNGGSFNTTSTNIAGGKTYNLRAYPNTDFAFVAWICNGDTLSKSSSYTYTMPYHDVEITGAFIYSPSNPSDPQEQAQKYTLTLKATPTEGGSFNTSSSRVSVGERYNLRAYPNTDFAFVAWLCEGDTLSKVASYDYTMPSHNVDITGVFIYRPSSPSDPQEQALKYQFSLVAEPMNSGSFNISNERLAVGSNNYLRAYSNTDFVFSRWTMGDSVLSTNPNMDFVMPSHNVQIVGHFEYNPASPANPNANYWNKLTGEVVVDDFTAGYLSSAISTVISGSSSNDVQMITVSGRINSNDFGVANNYKNCSLLDLSRVTGITEVPSYAFDYTNLETVYLPSSIEKIGARAFADCSKLSSITVYAMTPPTLESGVFQGVQDGIVVYVPAAAIAQYQDDEAWGKFTLLPIQEDIRSISISLPEGTNAQDYAQMWLELTNTKSGQRMHYVMTDRQQYTFANIIRNTSWNVTLRNERGDVFGQIDNVEVKDENVTVTFASLSKPQNVSLSVLTPDGNDVTNQVQVTWTDAQGNYVAQGASLFGLPVGYQVNYRMALSQELAMTYDTPSAVEYTLKDGSNALTCQLQAIKKLTLSGKVKDATTGLPLSGTVISASQTFSGKYSKTLNAKTDGNGVFTMEIFNVPTSVAIAATDYVSQTIDYSNNDFNGLNEFAIPDVSLKSITGATISVGFTYTTVEGETQNWYSDYQNVSYTLYNSTREKPITQFNVQYPQIVLLEEVEDGDVLRLTATSRTNAFMPVTATATIDEQKAEATFAVVELGKIQSSFTSTGNATVVGSLYDSVGKLVKTFDYTNASLTISNLADGQYTLVSMGSSRLFNTIYDLAQLPQTGLTEGSDYVLNTVEVKSGAVSQINIDEVPTLDESKLYYTGDNTSFTVNKPSIVAGNYLTLTGRIDFKPAYATSVSNVQMIVDMPESCEFVENSVMVGNSTSSYTLNGNRITIPMARYTDRVRFCIIPTLGGEYAPSAFAQFDLNDETVTQPIGSANYTAKDLSISVPSIVAKTSVPISGTAIGSSNIEIYDNGVLIGQTTSLANGTWATMCELNEPYNLSRHRIYAKVTTKQGIELTSENISCVYDMNAIQVSKVKMYHWNPEADGWKGKNYEVVFDFLNPSSVSQKYTYYIYNKNFSFTIEFTNNDTTKITNVVLNVKTGSGKWTKLPTFFDSHKNCWIANGEFGNMYDGDVPKNVAVSYDVYSEAVYDTLKAVDLQTEIMNSIWDENPEDEELDSLEKQLDDELDKDEVDMNNIMVIVTKINVHRNSKPHVVPNDDGSLFDELNKSKVDDIDVIMERYTDKLYMDIKQKTGADLSKINDTNTNLPLGTTTYKDDKTERSVTITTDPISSSEFIQSMGKYRIDDKSSIDGKIVFVNNETGGKISIEAASPVFEPQDYDTKESYMNAVGKVTDLISQNSVQISTLGNLSFVYLDKGLGDAIEAARDAYIESLKKAADCNPEEFGENLAKSRALGREVRKAKSKARIGKNAGRAIGAAFGAVFTYIDTQNDINRYFNDENTWEEMIGDLYNMCDYKTAVELEKQARKYQKEIRWKNLRKGGGDAVVAISETVGAGFTGLTFGASLSIILASALVGWGMQHYGDCIEKDNIRNIVAFKKAVKSKESCTPFPDGGEYQEEYSGAGTDVSIDPSGYVYEGVHTNRLEGVTATAYYKEDVEDMYGDLHEHIVKWDAEEYAQENPLFTDENGMYRWDVPQGLWQVKFEKEGYETTYSEWLPVPPPQLDVNIAMKQNVQPMVKQARAFEDAVEAEFDKYMLPELLTTENIIVMQGGKPVDGTIELLNEEASYENSDETFASKVRFNAVQPFAEQEVTLMVSNRVKSYAGIRMQDDFSQTFTVEQEIKQIVCEEQTEVDYGDKATLAVSVLPASASKGKTLKVMTSSTMILGVETEQVIIDEEGKAEITLSGELPGTAALTFSVEGTDKTAITIVNIQQKVDEFVAAPTANIASGSTVEVGTQITLFCKTEGATIYYTLDGSCPCDNTAVRKVYNDGTPIVINENAIIKAMAVAPDMTESDVVEFTYIVATPTSIEEIALNGEIQVFPLPIRDKLNVRAGGKTIKNVTVSSMKGVVVAESTKAATKITLDVSPIPTGLYIINVTTEDGAYNRKVLKVE